MSPTLLGFFIVVVTCLLWQVTPCPYAEHDPIVYCNAAFGAKLQCGLLYSQVEELKGLAEDGSDPALAALARGELDALLATLPDLQRRLLLRLLPRDEADDRSAVLEVSAAR